MKIQLRSQYDNFTIGRTPKYIEWTREPQKIVCYANECVKEVDTPAETSIALLIEPESIQPDVYEWMRANYTRFKYVFTHNSRLLDTLPNTAAISFGGVWASDPQEKTKFCSMISSTKELCPLHKIRLNLARQLTRKIDVYGINGHRIDTISAHAPYMFAVVIENDIDDFWFTEKICNCFANKTVPIYYGARKIDWFFDPEGIIKASPDEIPGIIDKLTAEDYNSRLEAINTNYEKVRSFYCFEDWFYNQYGGLLNGIINNS